MILFDAEQVLQVGAFLSVTAGVVVLFVGKALNERVAVLRKYNIPEPVTGGLLFSVAFGVVYLFSGVKVDFDLTARDILLVYFFTVIGINADVGDLVRGGKPLAVLLAVTWLSCWREHRRRRRSPHPGAGPVGRAACRQHLDDRGHGTAIAWAPVIAETRGVANAMEIGVVCATMGLVLASLAGGPVARFLIKRYRLEAPPEQLYDVGVRIEAQQPRSTTSPFCARSSPFTSPQSSASLATRAREHWHQDAAVSPLPCRRHPSHEPAAPCVAVRRWPSRTAALALIAEVSLGVFLAMSLMSMKLWTLADLAGPLSVLLALQLVLAVLFAVYVCFPALGQSYDAAVVSAGFIGFGLGANADRNGQHDRRDAAPRAFACGVPHRAACRRVFHRHCEFTDDPDVPCDAVTWRRPRGETKVSFRSNGDTADMSAVPLLGYRDLRRD